MNPKNKSSNAQVMYLGRWVNKEHFRTFVYNEKSEKIVNSYDEYEAAIASGLWFAERPIASPKKPKKVEELNTHGTDS